ncbi:XRE family transcriptional regulator [Zunongwangia atlantica]|uniref:Helix-turn-helix domain-containing protein n=1 Tax=Zunongwangia atlantica 22II14-10F7 TaxID=1185767 RepID=A0A1Y1SZN9_9FLAO|nr:helix-turn-helix transcriptional regulator [Zunongwangia atlantica]ORL43713.1 helix-turn-helix domain-containing protein [Zunongwangia atlantica 22II14-10F7]
MTGEELKDLRIRANLTQEQLAELVGMHKNTIYSYENRDVLPKKKSDLIAKELLSLITKKGLEANHINVNNPIEVKNEIPLENTNGNLFQKQEDGSFNITADIIPFEAFASYIETLEDATIHHDFDTAVFNVDQYGRGNYKAFRIKGDSMNGGKIDDVPDKALVLGREVGRHHWKDGFHKTKHGFIILCKENIFHKDIVDFDPETGDIICHSRNKSPEYSDFTINLNDVYQIFKVIKRFM